MWNWEQFKAKKGNDKEKLLVKNAQREVCKAFEWAMLNVRMLVNSTLLTNACVVCVCVWCVY